VAARRRIRSASPSVTHAETQSGVSVLSTAAGEREVTDDPSGARNPERPPAGPERYKTVKLK
jgi:hypothetical protein